MSGRVSEEIAVKVPASEAWKVYGTLKLSAIVREALTGLVSSVDIVQGDGAPGTILHLIFNPKPGIPGVFSYKEKYTVVDNEKRVKIAEVVEGGYLDMGFKSYRTRLEVIEKSETECVTRTTIEYEVNDEDQSNAASLVSIQPLVALMQAAASYLLQNTTTADN